MIRWVFRFRGLTRPTRTLSYHFRCLGQENPFQKHCTHEASVWVRLFSWKPASVFRWHVQKPIIEEPWWPSSIISPNDRCFSPWTLQSASKWGRREWSSSPRGWDRRLSIPLRLPFRCKGRFLVTRASLLLSLLLLGTSNSFLFGFRRCWYWELP